MRRGPYEVILIDSVTGVPLPEIDCGAEGLFTVAEPGAAFKIQVKYDDPVLTLVEADVDGQKLDYHYVLRTAGKAVTFQGFRVKGDFSAYREFKTSFPEVAMEDEEAYGGSGTRKAATRFAPEEWEAMKKAGTVEVTFYDAKDCHNCTEKKRLEQMRRDMYGDVKPEAMAAPKSVKLAEGKKVFKSLTTQPGAEFAVDNTAARRHHLVAHKEGSPIVTLTIRYQTSSWLMLKKLIDMNNPTHAALFQRHEPINNGVTTTPGSGLRPLVINLAGLRPLVINLAGDAPRKRKQDDDSNLCDLTGDEVVWEKAATPKRPTVQVHLDEDEE